MAATCTSPRAEAAGFSPEITSGLSAALASGETSASGAAETSAAIVKAPATVAMILTVDPLFGLTVAAFAGVTVHLVSGGAGSFPTVAVNSADSTPTVTTPGPSIFKTDTADLKDSLSLSGCTNGADDVTFTVCPRRPSLSRTAYDLDWIL